MSEIHKANYDPNAPTVHFIIDADKDTEHLEDKLEEKEAENRELSNKLEQITSIEFSKRAIAIGLNPSTATIEELKEKEAERKINKETPRGQNENETAYWNSNQVNGSTYPSTEDGLPLDMVSAQTPEALIQILNQRAKTDPSAKLALNKMNAKLVKGNKPIHIEYNGKSLLSLVKSDVQINENDPDSIKIAKAQKNERTRRDRTNWCNIEF